MGLFRPNIQKFEKTGDIENLLKCLKHRDSDVKIEAFKALSKKMSDKKIHNELRQMLNDTDSDVVATAVLTFYEMGEQVSFDKLDELMKVASKKQKIQVLKIIEEKCTPGMTGFSSLLIQAVNDKNLLIVEQAIKAIKKLKDSHTIGYIGQKLNEKSQNIRLLVIDALSTIGGDQVIDYLIIGIMDSNYAVRYNAENALRIIGSDKALKALNDKSFIGIRKGMEGMETERIDTIQHIGKQKITEALGLLHKACYDKYKDVRMESLKALASLAKNESIPFIAALLEDRFYDVRFEAVKALEKFSSLEALTALEKVLDDQNSSVKHEAKIAYDLIKKNIKV